MPPKKKVKNTTKVPKGYHRMSSGKLMKNGTHNKQSNKKKY